jgi:oligosaccharide repeat unit polymerase
LKLSAKKRWISLLSLLPAFFIVLFFNVKSTFIAVIMLWIVACITSFIATGDLKKWKLKRKNIILITVSGFLFFAILYGSLVFRLGALNVTSLKTANYKLSIYALGHIGATDKWFDTQKDTIPLFNNQWGMRSFYGISNPLHIAKREQGIYSFCTTYAYYYKKISLEPEPPLRPVTMDIPPPEGVEEPSIIYINNEKYRKQPMYSNVYTLFRPAMEDFGTLGSLIFFAIAGFLASCSYCLLRKKNLFFSAVIVLSANLFFYCYYITSAWAYSTYIAAFILFYVVLRLTFVKTPPALDS